MATDPGNIPVSLQGDKVRAPNVNVPKRTSPNLVWVPATGLEIVAIGFDDPVGEGKEIGIPTQQGNGAWMARDSNLTARTWRYTIFAKSNKVVYSSDPEIINEGQTNGADDEIPDRPGQGGGRPRP